MRIPPVPIPLLGFHRVPLHGREMTASWGRRRPRGGRARAFIRIDRPLRGAHMLEALGIRKIGRSGRDWIEQAGLPIHTALFFIAIPIFFVARTANPGLLIRRHFGQDVLVQLLALLVSRCSHRVAFAISCVASPKVKPSLLSPAALSWLRIVPNN